jgi:leader peptidase (prepilin peptidase) / N-methyltransferase
MGRWSGPDNPAALGKALPVVAAASLLGIGVSLAVSPDFRGAFGAALALLMLAIAVSDARHFLVPNVLTAPAFLLGLAFEIMFGVEPFGAAITVCLLRALAAALPFLALMMLYQWLRGRPGLGMGDVKLAAVAGAWLDWFTVAMVIEAAALAALITYAVWRYLLRRPVTATTRLPFGLFFAPAIWLGWVAETLMAAH